MTRKELDNYPSEPAIVEVFLNTMRQSGYMHGLRAGDTVLEPCAGVGALAKPLAARGLNVITNDLVRYETTWDCPICYTLNKALISKNRVFECLKCHTLMSKVEVNLYEVSDARIYHTTNFHYDAAKDALWNQMPKFTWVITNPPYSQLVPILERSLVHAGVGVAMILRLSALEPASKRRKRGQLLQEYADNLRFIMPFSNPRPSFTGDGKTDSVTTAWLVWMKGWSWKGYQMASPFQFINDWMPKEITS